MHPIITYILQVAIAQTILLACYWLLLRRDTFYKMNRWYFAGGLVFSFLIPLIQLDPDQWFSKNEAIANSTLVYQYIPDLNFKQIQLHWWQQYTVTEYLFIIMSIGSLWMFGKMLLQYYSLKKLNTQQQAAFEEYNIQLLDEQVNPFSFGKTIYINPQLHNEQELEEIIEHELIHILQKHSIDVVAGLINRCLFWWNPAAWLINKAMRDNLEFIADSVILEKGFNKKHYQYHLLRISQLAYSNSIVHHFNFSNLKKRIHMMNKKHSHPLLQAKWLLLIPVIALVLVSFNYRTEINTAVQSYTVIQKDTVPALPPIPIVPYAPNEKGYSIHMKNSNGIEQVIIKDKKGKTVKSLSINEWEANSALYERKYGKLIPPPPPPPTAPLAPLNREGSIAPLPPVPPVAPFAPIKSTSATDNHMNNLAPLSSANGQSFPDNVLYVIDGVVKTQEQVNQLSPNDIASVNVIKGSNGISKFGEAASNGVIEIQTKNNPGKFDATISIKNGISNKEALLEMKEATIHAQNESTTIKAGNNGITMNAAARDQISAIKQLLILDGKEISNTELQKIDPSKIETINVLKGTSATTIYGHKGKEGVIEIKLKSTQKVPVKTKTITYTNLFSDWVLKTEKEGC